MLELLVFTEYKFQPYLNQLTDESIKLLSAIFIWTGTNRPSQREQEDTLKIKM